MNRGTMFKKRGWYWIKTALPVWEGLQKFGFFAVGVTQVELRGVTDRYG